MNLHQIKSVAAFYDAREHNKMVAVTSKGMYEPPLTGVPRAVVRPDNEGFAHDITHECRLWITNGSEFFIPINEVEILEVLDD